MLSPVWEHLPCAIILTIAAICWSLRGLVPPRVTRVTSLNETVLSLTVVQSCHQMCEKVILLCVFLVVSFFEGRGVGGV